MRKIITCCMLLFVLVVSTDAQFSKGLRMFAGSGYVGQSERKTTFTGSNPDQYSRNLNAELYLGLSVFDSDRSFHTYSLHYQRQQDAGNYFINQGKLINQATGVGYTHTRLYPAFGKLFVSISAGGNVLMNFNQFYDSSSKYTGRGFQIRAGISPGIVYQIKQRLLLQAQFNNLVGLYYGYMKLPRIDNVLSNFEQGFRLSAGTNLGSLSGFGIGFYWVLK